MNNKLSAALPPPHTGASLQSTCVTAKFQIHAKSPAPGSSRVAGCPCEICCTERAHSPLSAESKLIARLGRERHAQIAN